MVSHYHVHAELYTRHAIMLLLHDECLPHTHTQEQQGEEQTELCPSTPVPVLHAEGKRSFRSFLSATWHAAREGGVVGREERKTETGRIPMFAAMSTNRKYTRRAHEVEK